MKTITLYPRANLRHFVGSRETVKITVEEDRSMDAILDDAGIPRGTVAFCAVDGKMVKGGYVPRDGEEIEILPALSGG